MISSSKGVELMVCGLDHSDSQPFIYTVLVHSYTCMYIVLHSSNATIHILHLNGQINSRAVPGRLCISYRGVLLEVPLYLVEASLGAVPLSADFGLLQLDQFPKGAQQLEVAGRSDVVVTR